MAWGALLAALPWLVLRLPGMGNVLQSLASWGGTPGGLCLFLAAATLYCAVGLPRQALGLAMGAAFGLVGGMVLATAAYMGGALLAYAGGRAFGSRTVRIVHRRAPKLAEAGEAFLSATPFRAVLALRLLPVGSALLVSLLSGAFLVSLRAFVLGTLIGGAPQSLVFVLAGSGLRLGDEGRGVLAAALLVASALLALWCCRSRPKPPS